MTLPRPRTTPAPVRAAHAVAETPCGQVPRPETSRSSPRSARGAVPGAGPQGAPAAGRATPGGAGGAAAVAELEVPAGAADAPSVISSANHAVAPTTSRPAGPLTG